MYFLIMAISVAYILFDVFVLKKHGLIVYMFGKKISLGYFIFLIILPFGLIWPVGWLMAIGISIINFVCSEKVNNFFSRKIFKE